MDFVRLDITDRVARVTLARPPLNVLHLPMLRELNAAVAEAVQSNTPAVAIIFAAAPGTRAFSAGVAVEDHRAETVYQMLEEFHETFRLLDSSGTPSIALIDGAALGGGNELALACDFVFATPRARFGFPEIRLGVFPPVAAILLPRIVGERRARELLLTGETIDANEALRLGMLNAIVPTTQLEQKAEQLCVKLRDLSAAATQAVNHAISRGRVDNFAALLEKVEDYYLNDLMKTDDAHEGINAFIEKRKPVWRNR